MTQRGDKPMVGGASQTKVIISNLKRDVDEEALAALCRQLGRVTNFRLAPGHSPDSPITAVVEYATPEEARDVVDHVDGRLILGQPVTAAVAVPGASYRQSSTSTLPPRNPPPHGVNSSVPTSAGQARAPYPSVMEDRNVDFPQGKDEGTPPYARYPRPHVNDPPRQFQPPPYATARPWEQDRRAPERAPPQPPTGFGEDFTHGQKQPPWPGLRRREKLAGPGAPKFNDDVHHNRRAPAQQWQNHDEISRSSDSESLRWEREGGRNHYPPQRASNVEHPEFHSNSFSAWAAETEARPPLPASNGVGTGQRPPPPPQRVPGVTGDSSGPPGIAPHDPRGGNGYVDRDAEDISVGKRRRPSPPNDGRGPPGPGHSTSAWREGPGHPAPPPESARGGSMSARDPAFDREVMRQAALLVAERELLTRENAKKQANAVNTDRVRHDEPVLQHYNSRQARGNTTSGKNTSIGHRRSRSLEDADRRKREGLGSRERNQRDGRDGDAHGGRNSGKSFDHQIATAVGGGNWREDSKRSRRDSSPHRVGHSRIDERAGKGRAEEKANERRAPSDRKYLDDNSGISASKYRDNDTPGRRQDDRWNNKDRRDEHRPTRDSRGRTSNSSREREIWERGNRQGPLQDEGHTRRPGDVDGSREAALGPSLHKNWDQSSADTGWYVHVGGISFSTTFTALAKRFAAFGDVNGFKVIFNNVTCRAADDGDRGHDHASKKDLSKAAVVTASTGFAFISFDDEEGMERAIECMNNQVLDGHILKVSRGRVPTEPFNSKPRPPALKSDRRWPPQDGSHHFHSPHQDRGADRRPTPAINNPAPFAKKSWPGAGSSFAAPGVASSHRGAGGGSEGVGRLALSANTLSARPSGTSRAPASGPSRVEANKIGDRRDPRDRDAAGRSRHGGNDNAFGGYGVDAGAMGTGKTKRGVRGGGKGFRDRVRGGGDGSSKDVDKRVAKKRTNDETRPSEGQGDRHVPGGSPRT